MQVIYGAGLASNILFTAQKRLIRPAYSNTLAHPYAGTLDPAFRNTDGSLNVTTPLNTNGASRTTAPFLLNGSIVPGTVMSKSSLGEYFNVHAGDQVSNEVPFGLLGQWIGGTFDNLGQNNQIGVWQGFDSVYELLAPAWDDTGTPGASPTAGVPTLLYAGRDGRLGTGANHSTIAVARILDRPSSSRLLIQLLI